MLLAQAGYPFEVIEPTAEAESGTHPGEAPLELAARMARQKAADVARRVERGVVLGCDTVVECQGQLLGKPSDREDARRMLHLLSGREHHVHSGLCLWPRPNGTPCVATATTTLRMDPLEPREIEDYLAGGQWQGKAGAFGLQDRAGWLHIVSGSESNVIGLPLELLAQMLAGLKT
jgi:septum formation protein